MNCVIADILSKIPRPNYEEIPALYLELDLMATKIARILMESSIFDRKTCIVHFEKASDDDIYGLLAKDPPVMIPFFVMVCGFSVRELERLFGISSIYSLRDPKVFVAKREIAKKFANAVKKNLSAPLYLETVIYKFYKNWEEHQKRHFRAKVEDTIRKFLIEHGYNCDKMKILCRGKEMEIDAAIPPDPLHIKVACQIRTGVRRDLVKRAKEFSSEFDDILQCYPNIRFVVIYIVAPHEKEKLEEIRTTIMKERKGKRPYDAVILTWAELNNLIKLFEIWHVPKKDSAFFKE